ncbi:TPA: TonB-dependent siderophore receptor, partial [Burkholderia contaminans]
MGIESSTGPSSTDFPIMVSIRLTYRRRPAPARHLPRAPRPAASAAPAAKGRLARRLAGAVLMSALLPLPALADTDTDAAQAAQRAARRAFDIPAGPLEAALNRFGRDAGILLAFPAELTAGLTSGGVQGRFDVDGALDRLLAGTGLVALRQPAGGYTLKRADGSVARPAAAGVAAGAELPAIDVRTSALRAESYRAPKEAGVLRSEIPLLDTAQAVNIVPAQVLRDQRPRNLDDALGNVSGITQGNTLAGTQDTIMKRGFGGNRDGSIMQNGMPLVQGRAFNAAVDSVEVLKGPTSLLYGLMDPGGVVNVVTKQPQLKRYNAISLGASTFGHGKNGGSATFDSTGPVGDSRLAYRLIVDQSNEQYWRNFGEYRQTFVAPSLAWYGRDTQVAVSYQYRKFHTPFDRGTALDPRTNAPLDIPARRRIDEPFNNMDGESHLAQLSVDHQFNADWSAHFGYSYNRETYDANQLR